MNHFVHRTCWRKAAFATEEEAEEARLDLQKKLGVPLHTYVCPVCAFFHNAKTLKPEKEPQNTPWVEPTVGCTVRLLREINPKDRHIVAGTLGEVLSVNSDGNIYSSCQVRFGEPHNIVCRIPKERVKVVCTRVKIIYDVEFRKKKSN